MFARLQLLAAQCVLPALLCASAAAQTPLGTAFTYQGLLKDGGNPVNGTHDLRFALFDQPVGGAQQGPTVCADDVAVTNGLFVLALDFGVQFAGDERFLEVAVRAHTGLGCANPGGFVVLTPRQPVTATPYALYAARVPNPLSLIGNNPVASTIFGQNDSGAFQSTAVFGLAAAASGSTNGVRGDAASPDGVGVLGFNGAPSGTTTGILGVVNAPLGRGVVGWNQALSGLTTGVYGLVHSPSGRGVLGESTSTDPGVQSFGVIGISNSPAPDSAGVRGLNNSAGQVIGVEGIAQTGDAGTGVVGRGSATGGYFESSGPAGVAVIGNSQPDGGTGILGTASGYFGIGVEGQGQWYGVAGSGAIGIRGFSDASWGAGVSGANYSTSGNAPGVDGWSSSTEFNARAVQGIIDDGQTVGVWGEAHGTNGAGVVGLGQTGGYFEARYGGTLAGFFAGNVNITGSAFKGGGGFKIDHPLDAENKYLFHSFVESPDMKNLYDGIVATDAQGYATVALPEWFEAVNEDFRYQLTVINAADTGEFISAQVIRKIQDGRFAIRTSRGGVEVSWQVTGTRKDPWASANRIPVEARKEEWNRGYYLHPEAYGAPSDRRIGTRDREIPAGGKPAR